MGAYAQGKVSYYTPKIYAGNLLLMNVNQIGETPPGHVADATDDTNLEGERPWSWMEEMAKIGCDLCHWGHVTV